MDNDLDKAEQVISRAVSRACEERRNVANAIHKIAEQQDLHGVVRLTLERVGNQEAAKAKRIEDMWFSLRGQLGL